MLVPGFANHRKTKALAARLGISRREAIGALVMLFELAGESTWLGDIGALRNREIADACDHDGPSQDFIHALIDCNWLDRCKVHRLVIHDWAEHAPPWIKLRAEEEGETLLSSGDRSPGAKRKKTTTYTPAFEMFYQAYPRKIAKHPASKAFSAAVSLVEVEQGLETEDAEDYLINASLEFAASNYVKTQKPDLIPHPATWLNARRYLDDRAEWNRTVGGKLPFNDSDWRIKA